MQTIKALVLAAGTGYQAAIGGRTFLMQSCDAGNVLTLTLTNRLGHRYVAQGVGPAFKVTPIAGFAEVAITTTADANVSFIVSDGDVDMQNGQVDSLIVNTAANPVHVSIDGGSVTLTATNVGINNTTANPVPVQLHTTDITLPVSIAAGANAIGTVGVTSMPALPAGANAIGTVGVTALPALPPGANAIGTVGVTALPALPAGANTIGSVNVNDILAARANAGNAFGSVVANTAVAGQYGRLQLWNPIGSGVTLYVEQISFADGAASGSTLYASFNAAELSGGSWFGTSKKAGGAASKGVVAFDNTVTAPTQNGSLAAITGNAAVQQVYPSAEPFVIPPGNGLMLWGNTVNTANLTNFEWYEQ